MIQSMTGYGKAVAAIPGRQVYIEIRAVNSKSLDLNIRMSSLLRDFLEQVIRGRANEVLLRGKVEVNVWMEQDVDTQGIKVDAEALAKYVTILREASKSSGLDISDNTLFESAMRMPDVQVKDEIEEISEADQQVIIEAFEEAVAQFIAFRSQEGDALSTRFEENVRKIGHYLTEIEPFEMDRVARIRARIEDNLEKVVKADYDKNRFEQEMIYYIEKLDIHEEKQRLANHLTYFLETIKEEGALGKKIGFISQEMGREINTLGSKSNQQEMQKLVVLMKDELEQIKEQVLNVL